MSKPSKEVLYKKYILEKKSGAQIGKELGYSQARISQLLREYKIPTRIRGQGTAEDLSGQRFGKLIAVSIVKHSKRGTLWLCKCDCGKTKKIFKQQLKDGVGPWSKGCRFCTRHANFKGYKEISLSYWTRIKTNARKRNISVEISIEDAWDIFLKQKRRCALSGVSLIFTENTSSIGQTASLDRIDSSKHYTIDNVQWVHKDINRIKREFPQEVFLGWINRIWNYQNNKAKYGTV